MNYWMATISQENFAQTRQQRWRIQGFTSPQRRKTERMQPGDRLLLYVREPQVFGMAATITSPAFQEQTIIWKSHRQQETFPYRVRIQPEAILREEEYIQALDLAPRLEYVRRWIPEQWPLAFQDELHLLSRRDFELIEGEMRRILRRRRGGGRPPQERTPFGPEVHEEQASA